MKEPIKLMVVDDSTVMRRVITGIFDSVPHINIVGEAANGKEALEMIPLLSPNVISLDIHMPVMDGLTALKHIMIKYPRPTVMCSTLTKEGESVTFDSLKFGAVDFIHKPSNRRPDTLEKQYADIIQKITLASRIDMESVHCLKPGKKVNLAERARAGRTKVQYVCGIGTSEGGYATLLNIIPWLKPNVPMAFIIILHEAPKNIKAFVKYLKNECAMRVQPAIHNAPLKSGVCYMASGQEYVTVASKDSGYSLQVYDSPFPNRRGSINMMMLSIAEVLKEKSLGIILSGSGNDGVEGMGEIARMGGNTFIQNPKACLHREMPVNVYKNLRSVRAFFDREMAGEINKRYSS
ncbi:chemotaxis protein CheB [Desulfobacterales bacterium HSG17]|nr:chemotaxis protein CheB [Desulfobacterales bacterium HSG17]